MHIKKFKFNFIQFRSICSFCLFFWLTVKVIRWIFRFVRFYFFFTSSCSLKTLDLDRNNVGFLFSHKTENTSSSCVRPLQTDSKWIWSFWFWSKRVRADTQCVVTTYNRLRMLMRLALSLSVILCYSNRLDWVRQAVGKSTYAATGTIIHTFSRKTNSRHSVLCSAVAVVVVVRRRTISPTMLTELCNAFSIVYAFEAILPINIVIRFFFCWRCVCLLSVRELGCWRVFAFEACTVDIFGWILCNTWNCVEGKFCWYFLTLE